MDFPGHELRARRIELGMSIEVAAADCAIPVPALVALEEGSLYRLPADCYTAGFIRSYCRLLGLEPEHYVGALRVAQRGGMPDGPGTRSMATRLARRFSIQVLPRLTSDVQAWALITAMTLLAWGAYSLIMRPTEQHDAPQAEAATVDLRLPQSLDGR